MDIDELERRTGVSKRQIRYLISLNLVPPPAGTTRSAAYSEAHVEAIEHYLNLEATGMNAAAIATVYKALPISIVPIAGVTLTIDPGTTASTFDAEAFKRAFADHLSHFFKEPAHADDERN